jgi:hypothetical protein
MANNDLRKSGRTTRLIDDYIQLLFTTDKGSLIKIRDHFPANDAHRMLMDKIIERMKNEHPGVELDVNYRERTIRRI